MLVLSALLSAVVSAGGAGPSLDDGPHVYWLNDTTAIVFCLFNGELEQRTFSAPDTVRFRDFCGENGALYSVPVAPPAPPPYDHVNVSRFLAVSDVHGDLEHFQEILAAAGVVDGAGRWSWSDGHLVIAGDVLDRGPEVTGCLWLIYRLEQEAARHGGAVHFLLGNHELMVLRGDLRYVHERYLHGIAGLTGIAYDDLFGPDMELGRWLRSRPAAVRIDSILFVHAGIAPGSLMENLQLEEINGLVQSGLDLSSPGLFFDDTVRSLYGGLGPLWYRGYHYGMEGLHPGASPEEVRELLEFYNVRHIVVGHTEHDSLTALYEGAVIAIDVPVEELGGQQALLLYNRRLYRVSADGNRRELLPD